MRDFQVAKAKTIYRKFGRRISGEVFEMKNRMMNILICSRVKLVQYCSFVNELS
jgi:hypothetical protein